MYFNTTAFLWILPFLANLFLAITAEEVPRIRKLCTQDAYEFQGYTYTLRGVIKYHTHCGFPNPRNVRSECGRDDVSFSDTRKYGICDPDNLIKDYSAIDKAIWAVAEKSPYICQDRRNSPLKITPTFVVLQDIQAPDTSNNDTCINKCGELRPELNTYTRLPTATEQALAIRAFAEGLRNVWNQDQCGGSIVVVIWKEFNLVYTALGNKAGTYLSEWAAGEIDKVAGTFLQDEDLTSTILYMTTEYQSIFHSTLPAYILLGLYIFMMLFGAVFCAVLMSAKDPMGYWDEFSALTPVEWLVKFISGVYFLQVFMTSLMWIQWKLRWWHILVLIGIALLSIIAVTA